MSTTEKTKKLDEWLRDWPVPERGEDEWNDLAERVSDRVKSLSTGGARDEWFQAPLSDAPLPRAASGGVTMSDEQSTEKPRVSLKDIAKRVSAVPPAPVTSDRASTPPAMRRSGEHQYPPAHIPEAGEEDSGVVDLKAVQASAAAAPALDEQPAQKGLFGDPALAPIPAPAPAKSSMTMPVIGGVIGLLAIAAAVMFVSRKDVQAPASTAEAPAAVAAAQAPAQLQQGGNVAQNAPSPAVSLAAANTLLPGDKVAPVAARGQGAGATRTDDNANNANAEASKAAAEKPAAPSTAVPAGLQGAMAGAVGAQGKADDKSAPAAAADNRQLSANTPEVPSQGALQGALGAVNGAAKACVAGMDGPSRASVTFAGDGHVTSVSVVSGPAAGKPAAGCISSAYKRAKVGPFQKSTYTVNVTVRP